MDVPLRFIIKSECQYTACMFSLHEEVREFCQARGLRLSTDLGQHFLVDEAVLNAIVATADIQSNDHIVEIGPGIGILTKELLKSAGHVTAIELDKRLIPLLKKFVNKNQKLETRNKLEIVQGNALHTPLPTEPYKIVANIPYHITSPLLHHAFLESEVPPQSMTLLLQREVGEKISNKEDAGILTILVGLFGKPQYIMTVPPQAFLPPPKVDSAILHIECFEKPLAESETIETIFKLTKVAFGQRRKMLRNTLGAFHGGMERLSSLGIDEKRRPQTLTIEEWIALAKATKGELS